MAHGLLKGFMTEKRSLEPAGKPAFLTPRQQALRDCFYVERLSSADHKLKSDQLKVRKVGLPPR
jgi:hypothetical protein